MNKQVKQIFTDIFNEFTCYQSSVAAVLSRYEVGLEAAKKEASRYKDEAGELNNRKDRLVSVARGEIKEADQKLHDAVTGDYLPKLRQEVSRYVCGRANRDFVAVLRDYIDFGLKLTRPELDALLLQADGSYTGLRMLASVAAKSGFRMTTPNMADYETETAEIERAVMPPLMWAPTDHVGAAVDVLEDVPLRRADGTVAGGQGRPTSSNVLMSAYVLNSVYKKLLETGERWATSFVPEISTFAPVEGEDGETIAPEQQREEAVREANAQAVVEDTSAVDWARQRAAKQAENDAKAAAGMEKYML